MAPPPLPPPDPPPVVDVAPDPSPAPPAPPTEVATSTPTEEEHQPPRAHGLIDRLWLMPGALFNANAGKVPTTGIGGEVSLLYVVEPLKYVGIFGQASSYKGSYGRYAAGVEAGTLVGLELAADFREKHDSYAGTWGVHVAPYLSLGFLSLALRFTVPVARSGVGDNQGFEGGIAITLKVPLGSYDHGVMFEGFGHGRPPRGGSFTAFPSSAEPASDAAEHWLACAHEEMASVATFAALAHDLARLDAPARLVHAALRAARDELRHGEASLRVAAQFDPRAVVRAAHAQTAWQVRAPLGASLASVVHDAIVDGMVGEEMAAQCMRLGAEDAGEGSLRSTVHAIANDEAQHAGLARAIVTWAASSGRVAARVVESALAAVPNDAPFSRGERRLLARRGAARTAAVEPSAARARIRLHAHVAAHVACSRLFTRTM